MPPTTTRLSTKGQVILPSALRRKCGWQPGQVLEVVETEQGLLLKPAGTVPPAAPGAAFGMLRPADGRARTLGDMERAITEEIAERHARGRY